MDALLEGGTMLWTRHLGFIGGGSDQRNIEGFWGECYSLNYVLKVYWGRDIVWTRHLGLMGRGSSEVDT